jgi:hypothetical protein
LVEPNVILAHVHASMVPIKMFGTRAEQEELEKRMTDEQIDVAEEIFEQFYKAPVCPYVFENEKMVGLQLRPETADKYARTPKKPLS